MQPQQIDLFSIIGQLYVNLLSAEQTNRTLSARFDSLSRATVPKTEAETKDPIGPNGPPFPEA